LVDLGDSVIESWAVIEHKPGHILTKCWGISNKPSYLPPLPLLVYANAPPVFSPFQLRSVTDEQHVRNHAGEVISAAKHWIKVLDLRLIT